MRDAYFVSALTTSTASTRRHRRPTICAGVLLLLLATPLLTACEEDVVAVASIEFPFEIYGVLDPTSDEQFVRVAAIQHQLRPSPDQLDASVVATDLETGDRFTFADSLLTFEDGTVGHVFHARFRPVGGHTYRVEVSRSDGVASVAEVPIPQLPRFEIEQTASRGAVEMQFGAPTVGPLDVDLTYFIVHGWCPGEWRSFNVDYRRAVRSGAALQHVTLDLASDRLAMRDTLLSAGRYNWTVGIVPREIVVRVVVGNEAWTPPSGAFDPELLVEPGTMTNVDNGFGFVGSGYIWKDTLFTSTGFEGGPTTGLPSALVLSAEYSLVIPPPPPVKGGVCVPYP